jgi:hypothetical protein
MARLRTSGELIKNEEFEVRLNRGAPVEPQGDAGHKLEALGGPVAR